MSYYLLKVKNVLNKTFQISYKYSLALHKGIIILEGQKTEVHGHWDFEYHIVI